MTMAALRQAPMAVGELVQRMDDPDARYGLALPNSRQYHGLVDRLPDLAKQR